ncbi:acyltransferase family protein [Pseudomonas entomophila]|uniref:acyltransferase family protein n=1 Tax=Pseudomonas entomophila TaxID=312306 RepID=UPI001F0177B7|nr:acyltransferase [Pseudomonas entomophila]
MFSNGQLRTAQPINPSLHGSYRYDVQGLRAIAVLAVILFHVDKQWLPAGFLGVDMFFVISGFIITPIIMRHEGKRFWLDFYWGRVRRIVPAFLAMAMLVGVTAAVFFIGQDFKVFSESLKYALLFSSNHYFSEFGSYFAPAAHELPLLHTWSLAIEMQFYLLMPCLIVFIPRRWWLPALAAIALGFTLQAEYRLSLPGEQARVYFSLLSRVPEFMVGACLAISSLGEAWTVRKANVIAGLALLSLFCCFFLLEAGHFPGGLALLPCVATAMLIAARKSRVSAWISAPVLVWLGAISYSLYLWHWPVLAFIRYWSGNYHLSMLQLLLFFVLTLWLACLSYYFIEVPLRRPGAWQRICAVAVVAVVAMFGFAPVLNSQIDKPLPVALTRYAPAEQICHGQMVGLCTRGDPARAVQALVIGDSHAAQLNYFFDAAGKQQGFSVKVVSASNCVPIPGFDVERIPSYSQHDCETQIQAVLPLLNQVDTIFVAGMWQWQSQSQAFVDALSRFLSAMSGQGKRVVVLAQIPMFEVNVQRMKRFAALGLELAPEQERSWRSSNRTIAGVVGQVAGAEFLDFSDSGFFKDAPYEHGVLMYLDNHHLNEVGAFRYGEMAGPTLAKLIGPIK